MLQRVFTVREDSADVYADLFEQADHAAAAREALETSYAAMASPSRR